MTKLKLLQALLLVALAVLVGCEPPPAANKKSEGGGGTAKKADSGAFVVAKPASYSGEFNPEGLEIGSEVGMLAPEIEGVDLDGVPFKLSDYRGKVVMLDFYGDW